MLSAKVGGDALILVQKPDLVKPNLAGVTLTCDRRVNTIVTAPMGISPVVGRLTLAQEAQVRILYPQPSPVLPFLPSLSAVRRLAQLISKQRQNAPKNLLVAFQKSRGWLGYRDLSKNIVLALIR